MKRPQSSVIYTHGGGRLGNQILRFLHWIAWVQSVEASVEVENAAFWPHAGLFEPWAVHPGCVFPLRAGGADRCARIYASLPGWVRAKAVEKNRFLRVLQGAGHWRPGWQAVDLDISKEERIDLDDPAFLERIARSRVTTCCGWRISGWRQVAEQENQLRDFFRPAPPFAGTAAAFIAGLRARHDLLVGVQIRQSDYAGWNDGAYFFPTKQYAAWMAQIRDLHAGRRIGFVVTSEVPQDAALFSGLPVYLATGCAGNGGHGFESWVELSLCDIIVSPPSTFSATAAWRGGVPLWPVTHAAQEMAMAQAISGGLAGAAQHPEFSRAVK